MALIRYYTITEINYIIHTFSGSTDRRQADGGIIKSAGMQTGRLYRYAYPGIFK
jgi:hypothetical protein